MRRFVPINVLLRVLGSLRVINNAVIDGVEKRRKGFKTFNRKRKFSMHIVNFHIST